MKTRLKIALLALAVLIGVGFSVAWYWLHNPDRYLPMAIANAEKRTGLQIAVQHVDIRYFPLRVRVYGLEVKNPKPFPAGDFLKVPMLEASVEWTPLLLQKKIVVHSLVLHQPAIDFISDPDGLWNFQNPNGPKDQPSRFSTGSIANLAVQNGVLLGSNLIDPSDKPGPVILELQNVCGDLKADSISPAWPGRAAAGDSRPADGLQCGLWIHSYPQPQFGRPYSAIGAGFQELSNPNLSGKSARRLHL